MMEKPNIPLIAQAARTRFGSLSALVVGDLMLDRYLRGVVTRISPEAPVPVVRHGHEASHAGGAGNVAANLAGLGLEVSIVGFVGADDAAGELRAILGNAGVHAAGVVTLDDRPTITKTRIISGHQHVLRVDVEDLKSVRQADEQRLLQAVSQRISESPACIVLSDYAKGVLSADVCREIIATARSRQIPVFVDPKGLDYSRYAGASVLTPNVKELAIAGRVDDGAIDPLLDAGRRFVTELGLDFLVLTRGADGMTLLGRNQVLHDRAATREVFDVSGAGDTVVATLAAGHVAGLQGIDLLHLANLAAGIVVGRVGTVAVQRAWLLTELDTRSNSLMDSVRSLEDLQVLVKDWRAQGERIVFTNGCFDILHAGHVMCLHQAAKEGDRLIVALNSDRSVRALKGPSRPVNSERERACVVAALASVDAVVCFDEPDPLGLIRALRPDVLVKGGDYARDQVVGAREVESWGGRLVLVPLLDGYSTSSVIDKVKN